MKDDTKLVHSGRDPMSHHGIVNMPVYHASTVLYPDLAAFKNRKERKYDGVSYGTRGTPTTFALADTVAALEGGHKAVVVSTGLAGVTMALMAFVQSGDHILVADSIYEPTRNFCEEVLSRFGVETTYYDPLIGAGIAGLFKENTRLVFTESPGSLTFEIQDIPAIAAEARKRGVLVLMDNTWGTPLYFKSFAHGVEVSIHAATKYISGGSDLVMGIIIARNEELVRKIKDATGAFGDIAAPDDCYLALRGLRSMAVRLRHHEEAALRVARFLKEQPQVARVMHPALPGDPGHTLWKRDFLGAAGLFGIVLHSKPENALAKFLDGLRFFKMGASWGGYESLIIPCYPEQVRTAVPWTEPGMVLRLNIGLEDTEDLIEDLRQGLQRLDSA